MDLRRGKGFHVWMLCTQGQRSECKDNDPQSATRLQNQSEVVPLLLWRVPSKVEPEPTSEVQLVGTASAPKCPFSQLSSFQKHFLHGRSQQRKSRPACSERGARCGAGYIFLRRIKVCLFEGFLSPLFPLTHFSNSGSERGRRPPTRPQPLVHRQPCFSVKRL